MARIIIYITCINARELWRAGRMCLSLSNLQGRTAGTAGPAAPLTCGTPRQTSACAPATVCTMYLVGMDPLLLPLPTRDSATTVRPVLGNEVLELRQEGTWTIRPLQGSSLFRPVPESESE